MFSKRQALFGSLKYSREHDKVSAPGVKIVVGEMDKKLK
jgi:hypothetical protein